MKAEFRFGLPFLMVCRLVRLLRAALYGGFLRVGILVTGQTEWLSGMGIR